MSSTAATAHQGAARRAGSMGGTPGPSHHMYPCARKLSSRYARHSSALLLPWNGWVLLLLLLLLLSLALPALFLLLPLLLPGGSRASSENGGRPRSQARSSPCPAATAYLGSRLSASSQAAKAGSLSLRHMDTGGLAAVWRRQWRRQRRQPSHGPLRTCVRGPRMGGTRAQH